MNKNMKKKFYFLSLSILIILLDQFTKYIIFLIIKEL